MLPTAGSDWRTRVLHWFFLVGVFFCAYAPTLGQFSFNDGMEKFSVLSSVEVLHDGVWEVPTLWGMPRLEKPPLVPWLSAAGISAGGQLEWAARWPILLLSCLTLVLIYEWARLLGNWRTGLVAAVMAGTSLFFIRFSRRAAYDAPLMFWVALTNLALTWGLFRGQWLRASIVGGLALGGAMMTKGPPALLHTIAPFAACCFGWAMWRKAKLERPATGRWFVSAALTLLTVTLISFLCMLIWAIPLFRSVDYDWARLMTTLEVEVTLSLEKADNLDTPVYAGLVYFWLLAPWLLWFFGAGLSAWRGGRQGRTLLYLLVMALLPVIVHSLMPPMRDRYLIPMLPAGAVAAGLVYMDYVRRAGRHALGDHLAVIAQYVLVAGFAIGYPIAMAASDEPPFGWGIAAAFSAAGVLVVLLGVLKHRATPAALVACSFAGMMLFQVAYSRQLAADLEPAKAVARQIHARMGDADYYWTGTTPPPRALAIYLGQTIRFVPSVEAIPPGGTRVLVMDGKLSLPANTLEVMMYKDRKSTWRIAEVK